MQFFKDYLKEVFEGALPDGPAGVPREYVLNHMICDFAESVRWWMQHETCTPEEISSYFLKTAPESCLKGSR